MNNISYKTIQLLSFPYYYLYFDFFSIFSSVKENHFSSTEMNIHVCYCYSCIFLFPSHRNSLLSFVCECVLLSSLQNQRPLSLAKVVRFFFHSLFFSLQLWPVGPFPVLLSVLQPFPHPPAPSGVLFRPPSALCCNLLQPSKPYHNCHVLPLIFIVHQR